MREILFRAKRFDNGEWVQGDLRQFEVGVYIESYMANGSKLNYVVDPKTVGRFTGVTAKNGKIFEGDIVNYPDYYLNWSGDVSMEGNVGAVEWDKATMCFYFSNRNAVEMEEFFVLNGCMTEVEVIGNIHDNPELLKGGADNG